MITPRPAAERGQADYGWLKSRHSFSFAGYHDPRFMGFRHLRVINEDRVQPGAGFEAHPHRDMEIITYVLEGALEHRDSLGTGSVIRRGEIQRMTAGTGIIHSEFNPSATEPVHFLQIWIEPATRGLQPSYEQRSIDSLSRPGELALIAGPEVNHGALTLHQDVYLYAGRLQAEERLTHLLSAGRHAWVQVAVGTIHLNGLRLGPGDGAALSEEPQLEIRAEEKAEFLLFDLS